MTTQDQVLDRADLSTIRNRRILILEDELIVALETKALVWRFGGIVIGPYARVSAALEAIRIHPVDAAILDVNIAGTQSFVVAETLLERGIPFIFCTGYGRDMVPRQFQTCRLVEKPFVPERLAAALAQAIEAKTREV